MPNTGFRDALNLMKLGEAADEVDEECSITPAPKKPRLADEIARGLEITPPPVVGMQSDSWFTHGDIRSTSSSNQHSLGLILQL